MAHAFTSESTLRITKACPALPSSSCSFLSRTDIPGFRPVLGTFDPHPASPGWTGSAGPACDYDQRRAHVNGVNSEECEK